MTFLSFVQENDMATQYASAVDQGRVLSEAVARVAACWKFTNEQLGLVPGISAATASRLRSGSYRRERPDKDFNLGPLLVRFFRSPNARRGRQEDTSMFRLNH